MSNISTFGAFTTARLGITSSQLGLNVTGNNITNINTIGYSRQRLDQISFRTGAINRYSNTLPTVGSGVLCTGISQIRDPYLDIRYRNSSTQVGAADAKLSVLEELSQIIDEVGLNEGDGILEAAFSELFSALEKLSLNADQSDLDTNVMGYAEQLCLLLNSYSQRLESLVETQSNSLNTDVNRVNDILANLAEMNEAIKVQEMNGQSANELRDQRNLLIDELSLYMDIDVEYEYVSAGAGTKVEQLKITLADRSWGEAVLVEGQNCRDISLDSDYKLHLGALTDLKGKEILPGTNPFSPWPNDTLGGALTSICKMLTCAGDYDGTTTKGIPYYQAAMDDLARTFAEAMNAMNKGDIVDENGDPIPGFTLGDDLFAKNDGSPPSDPITAGNICVSEKWKSGDVRIVGSFIAGANADPLAPPAPNSKANDNILKMLNMFDGNHSFVNGKFTGSFQQFLQNTNSVLATDKRTTTTLLTTYMVAANDIYNSRESVMGVDLNEEITNMMQYQQSYAAACRLLTTFDEALDKLINGTGVVGR